jgi:hypothetical protein
MIDIKKLVAEYYEAVMPWKRAEIAEDILMELLGAMDAARLEQLCAAEREQRAVVLPETGIGDLSDGYHTFNELYHHRAILFSVVCNAFAIRAWKARKHSDGTMFDGMFIVGIDTPFGTATYHYDIEPYWELFHVQVLELAPEWDGHTPDDAINRLMQFGGSFHSITADAREGKK